MQKKRNIIPLVETYNEVDTEKYIKSYMFIKGFAVAKNLKQTLIALAVARHFHNGQYRKDGMPYIVHPLKVCSTLINYGIDDDTTLAAALLHDLLEDCSDKLPLKGRELITEYHLSQEVLDIITLLTKESGLDEYELSVYFKKIERNCKACSVYRIWNYHAYKCFSKVSWLVKVICYTGHSLFCLLLLAEPYLRKC